MTDITHLTMVGAIFCGPAVAPASSTLISFDGREARNEIRDKSRMFGSDLKIDLTQ